MHTKVQTGLVISSLRIFCVLKDSCVTKHTAWGSSFVNRHSSLDLWIPSMGRNAALSTTGMFTRDVQSQVKWPYHSSTRCCWPLTAQATGGCPQLLFKLFNSNHTHPLKPLWKCLTKTKAHSGPDKRGFLHEAFCLTWKGKSSLSVL